MKNGGLKSINVTPVCAYFTVNSAICWILEKKVRPPLLVIESQDSRLGLFYSEFGHLLDFGGKSQTPLLVIESEDPPFGLILQ